MDGWREVGRDIWMNGGKERGRRINICNQIINVLLGFSSITHEQFHIISVIGHYDYSIII